MTKTQMKGAADEILKSVRVGAIKVSVKHASEDGVAFGDALTRAYVRDGHQSNYELAEKLRALADFFAGSVDEYKGGAEIFVLRRKA